MPPKPLLVEIIAYAPTAYYHCIHCEAAWREMGANNRIHEEQLESSLPGELLEEFRIISDWIRELTGAYCDDIAIKVIDATSIEGFVKALRYGMRRFPAVIVNSKRFTGLELLPLAGREIARTLGRAAI